MKMLGKWMLGAAVAAGSMGLGTTAAHAAQIGVYVSGGPSAYVPPCPGPGYQWVAGYYGNGYWVPGRWAFVGGSYYNGGYRYGSAFRDRDDFRNRDGWRDRDGYRGGDRDRDRGRDRDRSRDRDHDGHRDRR